MSPYSIGIDGGGSHSKAILVGESEQLLTTAEGSGLNPLTLGWKDFRRNFAALLEELTKSVAQHKISVLCAGLAGTGASAIQQKARDEIQKLLPRAQVHVITDAQAALWGAFQGGPGLLLIAGTGSICLGKNAKGTTARSGGFGRLLGDEGSGYWLALEAIRHSLTRLDSGKKSDSLCQALCAEFELTELRDIIPLVNSGELAPDQLAEFTKTLFALSHTQVAARELVQQAGVHLGDLIFRTAWKLQFQNPPVALGGGLWQSPRQELQKALKSACLRAEFPLKICSPIEPPEWGAVRYILKLSLVETNPKRI